MPAAPEIRTLSAAEVQVLVDWAADEGWNPGLDDATAFRAADREGFLGAFVDGEMVAGIAAVTYGQDFGFIGLYICRPDCRGRGYGKAVWDVGMARLSDRTVGLDGVPAQQENYRLMGFEAAYRTLRYSGRVARDSASSIRPVSAELFEPIRSFDRCCFPAERDSFRAAWLSSPRVAKASVGDRGVTGFGVARACRIGHKIGPLFASDTETAMALLAALAAECGGEIHIDVPDYQVDFIETLAALGLASQFETSRMYRGSPPLLRYAGVFGVTCLELG